jgi:hypothetical protein
MSRSSVELIFTHIFGWTAGASGQGLRLRQWGEWRSVPALPRRQAHRLSAIHQLTLLVLFIPARPPMSWRVFADITPRYLRHPPR